MEIVRNQREDFLELAVEGRLDGYWAQHLSSTVAEVMREGTHAVRLNLSRTSYISSAGIGVLVDLYKRFLAVNGSFAVTEPSATVKRVIEMVGLSDMLYGGRAPGKPAAVPPPVQDCERREAGGAIFEIHEVASGATLNCRLLGAPEQLAGAGFGAEDCRGLHVKEQRMALGLGAFGDSFESCRGAFGEFLAVAGGAACQPTDGTNFPDYMLFSGGFVPRMSALYGICCDGDFAKLVRFESASGRDPVPLSLIVDTCLEVCGAASAGMVLLAESAGLMSAALKRSPVREGADGGRLFAYPEIRRWLSFSPERCFAHSLALIAGVASSAAPAELLPFVRPLARRSQAKGHFHVAAFGYRPLQKGKVEMAPTVRGLFEKGGVQAVMHLLGDDREAAGSGETELLRGACWVSPIRKISATGIGEDGL